MRLATPDQVRELEAQFRDQLGLPLYALMEAAGGAVAARVMKLEPKQVVVVCGKGNNGGDGLVVARRLRDAGIAVEVRLVAQGADFQGDAKLAWGAWHAAGGRARSRSAGEAIPPGAVVVDAILGTGIDRPAEGAALGAIRAVNAARQQGAMVVAVDLPSGLSVARGAPAGECVTADLTVTFTPLKVGLLHDPAVSAVGTLEHVEIGIPLAGLADLEGPSLRTIDAQPLAAAMGGRPASAFKNTFGHVLVVGGMPGKGGALALAGLAALRAGAGLVTVASREAEVRSAQAFAPELMGHVLPGAGPIGKTDERALQAAMARMQVVVIGPGLAVGLETGAVVRSLCHQDRVPVVVDADGLNSLGQSAHLGSNAVLTPHPGEAARLLGESATETVQTDRLGAAQRLREATQGTVILKGARTLVSGSEGTSICLDGSVKLATAGSGDVLTGIVAALLARRRLPLQAAAELAVAVHARLGSAFPDRASLIATDLVHAIPEVMKDLGL